MEKNLISRETNRDGKRERESELGQEGKNLCMHIQEEATHQPKPSHCRREWWCIRVRNLHGHIIYHFLLIDAF